MTEPEARERWRPTRIGVVPILFLGPLLASGIALLSAGKAREGLAESRGSERMGA